ncbi:MAG TPA: OmpA family protein [Prolixibacteraceae bacterium]
MKKLITYLLAMFLCNIFALAQEKKNPNIYNGWEIGINAGVESFTGEYNTAKGAGFNHFNDWKSEINTGFGATAKKNFSQVFGLEAMWNYSNLTGSWKYDTQAIADFKTEVNEYNLNTVWNLTNLLSKNKFERKVYWFAKIGVGASHLWKKAGVNSMNNEHWKLPTVPLGTGVSFRLNDQVRFSLGTQWSWVNTDHLDGRSTDRVSGNFRQGYSESNIFGTKLYTHAGLSYAFGKKNKKKKPEPVVELPKAETEPILKPEPKLPIRPVEPNTSKLAVIGNTYAVYFGFDKWKLDSQELVSLDKLVKDMIDNPSVNVEIKSYTDSRGPADYNMRLSEKRGKSVIDYLVSKGINASRLNAKAFGKSKSNNILTKGTAGSTTAFALNRRTETVITQ